MLKRALVCGAGGFIGSRLVRRLKEEGFWVRGVDVKFPEFAPSAADDFRIGDLRDPSICRRAADHRFDEVWQLAADAGGEAFLQAPENDANVLYNGALINLNMLGACYRQGIARIFYASSASAGAAGDDAQAAQARFSERAYLAFQRGKGIEVRIARLHSVYGPDAPFAGGRESLVGALCRQAAEAVAGDSLAVERDAQAAYLYIEDCIEGMLRLMRSPYRAPLELAGEALAANELARGVVEASGKALGIRAPAAPSAAAAAPCDAQAAAGALGWRAATPLAEGLRATYAWVAEQLDLARQSRAAQACPWLAPLRGAPPASARVF